MPKRDWTTTQLRRIPELRHVSRDHRMGRRAIALYPFTRCSPMVLSNVLAIAWFMLWLLWTLRVVIDAHGEPDVGLVGTLAYLMLWWGGTAMWSPIGRLLPFLAMRARCDLRTELRRRGIPICVSCGYEGGDIDAPRCPECGSEQPAP